MKKKKLLFLLASLFLFIAAACSSGDTGGGSSESKSESSSSNEQAIADGEVITMKLGHANPPGDPKDVAANYFADLVNERLEGRVKIDVYNGGSLGDWRELVEGLKLGQNEIVIESIGVMNAYSDLANIDAVPYIYRDYDHFMKVWNSEVGQEIMEKVGEEAGLKVMAPQFRGARIVTSKRPFTNLEELKGLKIRAPGIDMYIETWKHFGTNPTPMAITEIYTGLQQGTVEAQENPMANSFDFGFHELAPYLVMTNHAYSATVFMFDQGYWDALPADIQEVIEEAALEAAAYRSQYVLDIEEEYMQKYLDAGAEVIYPDVDEFAAHFEGFVDDKFPYLSEYVERIIAVE